MHRRVGRTERTLLGEGSKKLEYLMVEPHGLALGFALKVEPQIDWCSRAMRRDVEAQGWDPIGILPPKRVTPQSTPGGGTYHMPYVSWGTEMCSFIAYNAICDLAVRPTPSAKLAPAALCPVVYPNLPPQALSNMERGSL